MDSPQNGPRRKGRPKRHPVEEMRAAVWYDAVEQGLALPSAYAVEKYLEPKKVRKKDGVIRPRKWDGYRNGKHTPSDAMIELAEVHAPGTEKWFRSPVWSALRDEIGGRFPAEQSLQSNPAIMKQLFRAVGDARYPAISLDFEKIANCIELEGLDLFECVVLLLEAGFASRDVRFLSEAQELYFRATRKITETPQLARSQSQLLDWIEDRYCDQSSSAHGSIFIPWAERLRLEEWRSYESNYDGLIPDEE